MYERDNVLENYVNYIITVQLVTILKLACAKHVNVPFVPILRIVCLFSIRSAEPNAKLSILRK